MRDPNTISPEEALTHCEVLKKSEAFQWWLRINVTAPLAEADEKRSDLSISAEQRTNALVEWTRLKEQDKFLATAEMVARRNLTA